MLLADSTEKAGNLRPVHVACTSGPGQAQQGRKPLKYFSTLNFMLWMTHGPIFLVQNIFEMITEHS